MYFKFYLEDDKTIWSQGHFNDAETLLKAMLKDFTIGLYRQERNNIIDLYGSITIESIKNYCKDNEMKLELYREAEHGF